MSRFDRGAAGGEPWFTDYGPDLSRGFRALKVWFTLRVFGLERLGQTVGETFRLAQVLAKNIQHEPDLELLGPHPLNIVCFRFRGPGPALSEATANAINKEIVVSLQEDGIAVPSTIMFGNVLSIRVAIVNHRCREPDLQLLLREVLDRGRRLAHAAFAGAKL